ncbi:MAG TPA: DUF983 domain-containing protein [Longimicrobium sp.]|nr:DUF983 domain-containing protein [Longimicrobium sp.]
MSQTMQTERRVAAVQQPVRRREPEEARPKLAVVPPLGTRVWRAARLRCPVCGSRGLLQSWMKLRPRCPTCGLRVNRGEHDFFLGAMMFNIALAEGTLAIILVGLLIALWPNVPWTALEIGAPVLMIIAPFIFYPFSQTIWLAFDLLLHPLTEEELDWHRTSDEDAMRKSDL